MRMFQIQETDLAELEHMLPVLLDFVVMRPDATPLQRTMFRRVQKIITDVRWGYGPAEQVETE